MGARSDRLLRRTSDSLSVGLSVPIILKTIALEEPFSDHQSNSHDIPREQFWQSRQRYTSK